MTDYTKPQTQKQKDSTCLWDLHEQPALFPMAYAAGFIGLDRLVDDFTILRLTGAIMPDPPSEPFEVSGVIHTSDFDFVRIAFQHVITLHAARVDWVEHKG